MTESITMTESRRLIALERTIEAGRKTFVEVGIALAEIRDSRLYRSDFITFEDYCTEKWGWTKQHVYRLIEVAPIAKSNPQVTSINQARELAKIAPTSRVAVLEHVVSEGLVTAKAIREAAQHYEPGINSMRPVSEEAINADSESDSVFQLKRWWKKASKQDRKKFLRWVESTGEKQKTTCKQK